MKEKLIQKLRNLKSILCGMKRRYYVIFGIIFLFSIYNTITLRGFYYAENYWGGKFGCLDWWHGYTNVVNRTYTKGALASSSGYMADPETIHDIENAHEWYGSILGTVVFMKWKWVGLHFGNHMILIDTSVPELFTEGNHILGHPYYILKRYDNKTMETSEAESEKIVSQWQKIDGVGCELKQKQLAYERDWDKHVGMYKRITALVYIILLILILSIVIRVVGLKRYVSKMD